MPGPFTEKHHSKTPQKEHTMNTILKNIGQSLINQALPAVKADLKARAGILASQPKSAAVAPLILPFLDTLLDSWTIKL